MCSVAAIIIAAGPSSRLGQPKQLVTLDDETLLQRTIRIAQEAGANPVFVVLGAHREQIESRTDFSSSIVVTNPDWEEGMASSIRVGIESLDKQPETAGVLLLICDQLAVTAEHLGQMLVAFEQNPSNLIASRYAGKRGIPAIFPSTAFAKLLALRGDKGARELLSGPDQRVIEVPLENGGFDIDSPQDLARLLAP